MVCRLTLKSESVSSAAAPLKELLAQRAYIRFLLARISGLTANQMLMVAVAWHMYDLTSSAWDLGLVGLFSVCASFAGGIARRSCGRPIPPGSNFCLVCICPVDGGPAAGGFAGLAFCIP